MFKKSSIAAAAAVVVAGWGLAGEVLAQTSQRVEITGTSIKRIADEGALPVQTFTQEDIKKSGVTSVTDFIQQLPVMQGFTVAADSVGGGGGGIMTASIHDVGEQYTLVLLNGRRIAPATSGTTIDLRSIPLAAIDRIEILTDGASALYGSDAIAGVVNFILKKGEAPFQIDVRVSQPQHRGGEETNASISKGIGNLQKDGYSLFGSLSFDKSKQLKASQRDFAKTGQIYFKDDAGRDLFFFNGSSRGVPPNVDVRYNNPSLTNPARVSTYSFNPYQKATGSCAPLHQAFTWSEQCWFDYTSTVEIAPELERTSLFGSAEVKLGNSGFKGFADLALTDSSVIARIAPYPAEFSLATTHPYYTKYVLPYLSAAQAANVTSVNVKYRLYDMGNRTYDYNTKATHLVAGVDGLAMGWDVNTALTVSKQKQDQNYLAGFPLDNKFTAALNAQTVDPFPYPFGKLPPAQLTALQATQYVGNYNTTNIDMVAADARASREVFKLGGGMASLGLGADFRNTGYKVTANKAVANAEILFDDPQAEYNLKRSNSGAFAELFMPVMKNLEFTGGVRFDSITGIDDKTSGKKFGSTRDATTYKLSGKFTPTSQVILRGSYGTGFRSASMTQIAQPEVDFGVTGGSYQCPFTATYDPLGYIARGYVCPNNLQQEVWQGGNPALRPEKSTQWTLGAVIEPIRDVSVGVDLWSVEVKDAVTSVSERLILTQPAKYLDLYRTKTKVSNNLTYVSILLAPVNIGRSENTGVDWDLQVKKNTDLGRLTARLSGTYLIKSRYTTPGTSDQWETSLGRFGSNDAVSFRNVIAASASLAKGGWTNTLKVNYRSGYTDILHTYDNCAVELADGSDCAEVQLKVPENYTFDWQTRYAVNKNLALTLGVINLADRKPPLSLRNTGSHQLGYDPRYASPLGRSYYLSGNYQF